MNPDVLHNFILRGQAAHRAASIKAAIETLERFQSILTEQQLARVGSIANRPMATVNKKEVE